MKREDRTLAFAWLKLMALTILLAIAADVTHVSRLSPAWIAAIVIAIIWKARLVLGVYLGLKAAPPALAGFTSAVLFIVVLVALAFVVVVTPRV
ncbi:MAG: hypothetical protein ACLPPF_12615 [Rhodomicrobium sp.]